MPSIEQIKGLLDQCTKEQRLEIFNLLRKEFPIHPLEDKLNAKAEVILEAFSKANDLTLRGLRGIIAEACFVVDVVGSLKDWRDITPSGDFPYDCLLEDPAGQVRVQIKMQRMKQHRPMMANEAYRFLPAGMFVTETQRTRGGLNVKGEKTRPYRFGEFDILGVCLHPSTGKWTDFVYTVANWLIPDPNGPKCMLKFQPVSVQDDADWTRDFLQAVRWFRNGQQKQICADSVKVPESTRRPSPPD